MKTYLGKVLSSFEYESLSAFTHSLCPSLKYNLVSISVVTSALSAYVEIAFGFNGMCLVAFLLVMLAETVSGLMASKKRREAISSVRMSRFSLKTGAYLACLFVTNSFRGNFEQHGQTVAATVIGWINIYLIMHFVVENVISVLENTAELQGKPKTHYLERIKAKLKDF